LGIRNNDDSSEPRFQAGDFGQRISLLIEILGGSRVNFVARAEEICRLWKCPGASVSSVDRG
jgi:hypothetical protein